MKEQIAKTDKTKCYQVASSKRNVHGAAAESSASLSCCNFDAVGVITDEQCLVCRKDINSLRKGSSVPLLNKSWSGVRKAANINTGDKAEAPPKKHPYKKEKMSLSNFKTDSIKILPKESRFLYFVGLSSALELPDKPS